MPSCIKFAINSPKGFQKTLKSSATLSNFAKSGHTDWRKIDQLNCSFWVMPEMLFSSSHLSLLMLCYDLSVIFFRNVLDPTWCYTDDECTLPSWIYALLFKPLWTFWRSQEPNQKLITFVDKSPQGLLYDFFDFDGDFIFILNGLNGRFDTIKFYFNKNVD